MRNGAGTYHCTECGVEFYKDRLPYNPEAVFCSSKCMGVHMSRVHTGATNISGRPKKGVEYSCDNCGDTCYDCQSGYNRNEHHFCGEKCQREFMVGNKKWNYVEKIKIECGTCSNEFEVIPSTVKNGHGKYCSKECQFKSQETAIDVECKTCGENFKKFPSTINENGNVFAFGLG